MPRSLRRRPGDVVEGEDRVASGRGRPSGSTRTRGSERHRQINASRAAACGPSHDATPCKRLSRGALVPRMEQRAHRTRASSPRTTSRRPRLPACAGRRSPGSRIEVDHPRLGGRPGPPDRPGRIRRGGGAADLRAAGGDLHLRGLRQRPGPAQDDRPHPRRGGDAGQPASPAPSSAPPPSCSPTRSAASSSARPRPNC